MSRTLNASRCAPARGAAIALLTGAALLQAGPLAAAQNKQPEKFITAEAAAEALGRAWADGRTEPLLHVLGSRSYPLVISGDPIEDRSSRLTMAQLFARSHRLQADGPDREILVLGAEAWPYPIPIVRHYPIAFVRMDGSWTFDLQAGEMQILDRRIGRNEMSAMETCRAFVLAQREFAARYGHGAFARKVDSTPGTHDGLYWKVGPGQPESPLGPRVAVSEAQGYGEASRAGTAPLRGYYFRVLTAQGRSAPGGEKAYLAGGRMTGGFALLAWPAKWRDSGVMTFMINQAGIVFEKNLGPDTARLAPKIETFDPDSTWRIAETEPR
ncbi:MAG TPA: DUF2950 domain-containing protein [Caulobacteraceae bacterium]|jgi:hypothetical protein